MSARHERDVHREIAGRELEILQAVGIHPQHAGHQHCPFPDHEDKNPSWRWDAHKRHWFCSCGSGSAVDAVMRAEGLDARESILWIRRFLEGGQAPRRRTARAAPPLPSNDNAEQQKHRLQEQVAARAREAWQRARPARADHAYLVEKGVKPHELRQQGGTLYAPLYDIDGRLWNVQMISRADGSCF